MKKPTKKLTLTTETIRNLQSNELTRVVGGSAASLSGNSVISVSSGTSVISVSSGTSVISRNPSGGITSVSASH